MKAPVNILVLILLFLSTAGLVAQFSQADMALDLDDARTFRAYPTYEHYQQLMQDFASGYPDICRLDTFGTTPGGRQLLALKISGNPGAEEAEAPFLYTSTMHGDEPGGFVLLLRLADTLLRGYGTDPEIDAVVDGLETWINPLANPDGAYAAGNHSLVGATRENAPSEKYPSGKDLNRDFPDPAYMDADDTTGREPETRAMMEFLRRERFVLSANIHSGAEVVNYPWDHTYALHADDQWYRFVSREYADEAMTADGDYMFGWPEGGITNGAQWYPTNGSRQDYVNFYLEGREVTLELSLDKQLPSEKLEWLWRVNYRSLLNYMSQCLYGIRGHIRDADTQEGLVAEIRVLGHDSAYSAVHSRRPWGDYYRLIAGGNHDLVFSAPGYIPDTLWQVEHSNHQATFLDVTLRSRSSGVRQDSAGEPRIWPNPARERVYIRHGEDQAGSLRIRLCSSEGKVLLDRTVSSPPEVITLAIPPGLHGLCILQLSSTENVQTFPLYIY